MGMGDLFAVSNLPAFLQHSSIFCHSHGLLLALNWRLHLHVYLVILSIRNRMIHY